VRPRGLRLCGLLHLYAPRVSSRASRASRARAASGCTRRRASSPTPRHWSGCRSRSEWASHARIPSDMSIPLWVRGDRAAGRGPCPCRRPGHLGPLPHHRASCGSERGPSAREKPWRTTRATRRSAR
jgi:hypothetical protein